jgi:aspartate racemase
MLTPALREELAGRRAEILAYLRRATLSATPIRPTLQDVPAPLSYAQERLWFLDQLEPGSPTYNVPAALQLEGALDAEALVGSLNEIVARHEALRTAFPSVDGQPVQRVATAMGLHVPVVDLSGLPESEREGRARRLAEEEARRPFDLARGPLLRAKLLRLDEEKHLLLLTMHHIVSDGWSAGILSRELATLYEAFSSGQPSPLRELPIQYSDFAIWQREWLQGEVLEAQLSYWRQQLAGAPALLELPTDRPRPAVQTYRGGWESVRLPLPLSDSLRTLSRHEGATLFMTLLAAFQVLLHRYTGQEDIVVGTPIANRNREEIEGLIGFFVNTLVMRSDLSGNPTFRELLREVREVCLQAYDHQDLPFEKLVQELQPERNLSYAPVAQVVFAFQNLPLQRISLANLKVSQRRFETGTAKFDLLLSIADEVEGMRAVFGYNTDLFDATTIKRMAGHFQTLVEGVASDPDQQISLLPLLTQAERHRMLVEWNDTRADYPRGQCVHQLFEAQVERTPEAVAVVFGDRQLTYRELNRRANRLAHYLRKRGVGPEALVAICVERSLELVVGLLGILKAGGAYVPLGPSDPKERLAFLLEDAGASLLLTTEQVLLDLPDFDSPVVRLDENLEAAAGQNDGNPLSATTDANLAYVMYTSGSTGRPKGVSVVHRGVVRLVKGTDYARLTANEVFLQFAPLSFDASTFEIWGALLNGARLVVCPPRSPSLQALGRVLKRHEVTTIWLTAGLFHQMVDDHIQGLRPVRQLLAGGDVLSAEHAREALSNLDPCYLVNGYGPTENTTFTTCYAMTDPQQVGHSVPIGRPIGNTQVYLLDRRLQPVPVGVPGELHIGGDGLARGYLNRPALTAGSFIPNPFRDEPGSRLYKTGDWARYRPDGNIEFLGRMDYQVKIRGFRVELGEIETVLRRSPSVREAVVLARDDGPPDASVERMPGKRLVGYVVPKQGSAPAAAELRHFLRRQLPEYMIPSHFVMLRDLPLTSIGKVDRRLLPAPDLQRPMLEQAYVAPRTSVEGLLAGIWREVLGLERIGVHDSFFALGGHSLMATRLVSRIRDTFHVELPLRRVFEAPTVAEMAMLLVQDEAAAEDRVERLLDELDAMSDEEVRQRLHSEDEGVDRRE